MFTGRINIKLHHKRINMDKFSLDDMEENVPIHITREMECIHSASEEF